MTERSAGPRGRRASRTRPNLERVEQRLLLAVFDVTSAGNSGPNTLEAAIQSANSTPGADQITFHIASGQQTIFLTSPLDPITEAVTIDATTQPGFAGVPLIAIDGSSAGSTDGLTIRAPNVTVRGLIVDSFHGSGIVVDGPNGGGHDTIAGNWVGLDPTGAAVAPNQVSGIFIDQAGGVTVGGPNTADRNVISANAFNGIEVWGPNADGNAVLGNYIGTDATGEIGLGNKSDGVFIRNGVTNTTIRNSVISGNGQYGIDVLTDTRFPTIPAATLGTFAGNLIGLDANGRYAAGNLQVGISLGNGCDGFTIGGPTAADRNVISANGEVNSPNSNPAGILMGPNGPLGNVVQGNYIGTDITGTQKVDPLGVALGNYRVGMYIGGASGDKILDNVISGNILHGIQLASSSHGVVIQGNLIGLDSSGELALGNGDIATGTPGNGITIAPDCFGIVVGGTTAAERNVISANYGAGVRVFGFQNTVIGNYIGTDAAGALITDAHGNALGNGYGVGISQFLVRRTGRFIGGYNNTIGGSGPGEGNLVAGSVDPHGQFGDLGGVGVGVVQGGVGNAIFGNFIGSNSAATPLPNRFDGVLLESSGNTVGGAGSAGNVISGNRASGILVQGTTANGNTIQGNAIGTDVTGAIAVPNGASGVAIVGGSSNLVGGAANGAANRIAFNAVDGVNVLGTDQAPAIPPGTANAIISNSIYSNAHLGIELGTGANGSIVPPSLTASPAVGGVSTVRGTVQVQPNATVVVQLFNNPATDPGQGRTLVTTLQVQADRSGAGSFTTQVALPVGSYITATATTAADGTSEFSAPVLITQSPPPANPFLVTNTQDSGPGSLRQAILNANNNPGVDTITFAIPGGAPTVDGLSTRVVALPGGGPFVINVLSPLEITDPVVIDGYSQAGSQANSLAGGDNAVLQIVLNGSSAGSNTNGLTIESGGSTVRGLVIQDFAGAGIFLETAGKNTIAGDFLGTDPTGTQRAGNAQSGVLIGGPGTPSSNNLIGGTTPAGRNVISGNGTAGVLIFGGASNNQVEGNFIGTDATGTRPLANAMGGVVIGASDGPTQGNVVGGTDPGAGNVLSGNDGPGVYLYGGTSGNTILGNRIGTDVTGTLAVGNANIGVLIYGSPNNTVGGTTAAARNIISGNRAVGSPSPVTADPETTGAGGVVLIGTAATGNRVVGNFIGTTVDGNAALGNAFDGVGISGAPGNTVGGSDPGSGNVISGNRAVGVRIAGSHASGNRVLGNFIGTNAAGNPRLGNAFDGVYINGAPNNAVGGTGPVEGNVIGSNGYSGVDIANPGATGNQVLGNFIGTDRSTIANLGNAAYGVLIQDATNNTVGGTGAGAGNVIMNNGFGGVQVLIGGSPPSNVAATGNQVVGNTSSNNGGGSTTLTTTPMNSRSARRALLLSRHARGGRMINRHLGHGFAWPGTSPLAFRAGNGAMTPHLSAAAVDALLVDGTIAARKRPFLR